MNPETGQRETNIVEPPKPEKKPLEPQDAKNKTERLLKFRDFLQKWILAWAAGDPSQADKFTMVPWELEMLADVYNDIILSMGYIPKWFDILIAESLILVPKIKKVFDMRALKKELANSQKEKAALQEKVRQLESQSGRVEPVEEVSHSFRTDAKKWWDIDNEGFFNYDQSGYLSKVRKKEKPDVEDPYQYKMLVKHNGKDKIHEVFKIGQ